MPQQPETNYRPCWKRVPPECPVRVPLSLHASGLNVTIGWLERGDGDARAVVGGVQFETSGHADVASACAEVAALTVDRIHADLQVGDVIRRIVGRRPVMVQTLTAVAKVLMRYAEADEREVLQGLVSGQSQETPE